MRQPARPQPAPVTPVQPVAAATPVSLPVSLPLIVFDPDLLLMPGDTKPFTVIVLCCDTTTNTSGHLVVFSHALDAGRAAQHAEQSAARYFAAKGHDLEDFWFEAMVGFEGHLETAYDSNDEDLPSEEDEDEQKDNEKD